MDPPSSFALGTGTLSQR